MFHIVVDPDFRPESLIFIVKGLGRKKISVVSVELVPEKDFRIQLSCCEKTSSVEQREKVVLTGLTLSSILRPCT